MLTPPARCGDVTLLTQTGAGKTYTMGTTFSSSDEPASFGVIPRVVEEVFALVDAAKDMTAHVRVSYLEIYNEQLRDLLLTGDQPQRSYTLQRDEHGNYIVPGLTMTTVTSLADVAKCLEHGSRIRSTASTNMNAHSSRSHAVFTIHLDQDPVVLPVGMRPLATAHI